MSGILFEYLVDNLEMLPELAKLNHAAWGHFTPNRTFDELCAQMRARANKETLPIHLIATENSQLLGGAILKLQEMPSYPEKEYCLGSVVVKHKHSGKGIGSKLALKICDLAKQRGIKQLYLQTEALDGGLYAKIGWEPVEKVIDKEDDVLIMVNNL